MSRHVHYYVVDMPVVSGATEVLELKNEDDEIVQERIWTRWHPDKPGDVIHGHDELLVQVLIRTTHDFDPFEGHN